MLEFRHFSKKAEICSFDDVFSACYVLRPIPLFRGLTQYAIRFDFLETKAINIKKAKLRLYTKRSSITRADAAINAMTG